MTNRFVFVTILLFAAALLLAGCVGTPPDAPIPPPTETAAATEPLCEHLYESVSTPPTCTEPGSVVRRCTRCGDTETETIPPLGHQPGAWQTVKEPTLTEEGVRTATCSVCGAALSETVEKIPPPTALSPEEYYGYRTLGTMRNAAALQRAYRTIAEGAAACLDTIDVSRCHIGGDELYLVYLLYRMDYPQHFWVSREFAYEEGGAFVRPTYITFDEGLDAARKAFDAAVDEMLAGLSVLDDEFTRELTVHDRLVEYCGYRVDGTEIEHSAYAALVNGTALCEGYARAMQCLLYRCGMLSFPVNGTVETGKHQWNIVRVDGEFYHLDVTFDDPSGTGYRSHRYFNVTTKEILQNHTIDAELNFLPIPDCTAVQWCYPRTAGIILSELTAEALADAILRYYERWGETDSVVLYYMEDPSPVGEFLKQSLWPAIRLAAETNDVFAAVKTVTYLKPSGTSQFVLFLKGD